MKKIGLIDYFLNEWHANNLPQWVKDASKGDYEVAYAYGKIASPDGMTSAQWCETHDVTYCESIEEVNKCDFVSGIGYPVNTNKAG